MKQQILAFATGLLITVLACSSNQQSPEQDTAATASATTPPAQPAVQGLPAMNMQDAAGNTVALESFKGKKVFVNLWATWCGPCRKEMPSIQKLYKSLDTTKVAFVLLSLDDQFEKAKSYTSAQKLELPLYYPAQQLPPLFNVEGIPTTFIFNEAGDLVKQIVGSENYNTDAFKKLLQ